MCKLSFIKLEKKFYEKLYKDLFFNSKNKNNTLLRYYRRKLEKIDKKINLLNDCDGSVVYFKDIDTYQPYFT
jgi:hypothetical protein